MTMNSDKSNKGSMGEKARDMKDNLGERAHELTKKTKDMSHNAMDAGMRAKSTVQGAAHGVKEESQRQDIKGSAQRAKEIVKGATQEIGQQTREEMDKNQQMKRGQQGSGSAGSSSEY